MQNNGNVGAIANNITTARRQSFTYDELNRIATAKTQATSGQYCWGETFSYDIWANLKTIGAITPDYNGCTQENLEVDVTVKNQIDGSCYDAAGNLALNTPCPQPPGTPITPVYTYDAENRMTATGGVTYSYDGDGRRVRKSNGTLYWYGTNALDPVMETDLSGGNAEEFIFFNGRRTARRDAAGAISYFFADHLGTSRVVTNATGTIVEDSDFYPFGGERVFTDTLADQNYNNPLRYTDPNGHCPECPVVVTTAQEGFTLTTTLTVELPGGAAGGGFISALLLGGTAVAGGAFALYTSLDLYYAEREQMQLFAQVDKENRQRLYEQQRQQQPNNSRLKAKLNPRRKGLVLVQERAEVKLREKPTLTGLQLLGWRSRLRVSELRRLQSLPVNQRPADYDALVGKAKGRLNRAIDQRRKSEEHHRSTRR